MKKNVMNTILKLFGLSLLTVTLWSCGKDGGYAPSIDLPSTTGNTVVITPNAITVAASNVVSFSASGGSGSYSYSVFSGSGTVLSTTGSYTAPSVAGTAVIRVVDGQGQYADAIVTINDALAISPATQSLSLNATQAFTATGGVPPVTFSLSSGLGSVDASGLYTAPASPGSAVVRATDSYGNTADAAISIFGALGISPLTDTVAVNNTIAFSAGGGVAPYTYSIFSGGGSINASTGFFTAPATAGSVTVRVTDALLSTSNAVITVNPALQISPTTQTLLINGTVTFSAVGGVNPLTYSLVSGTGSINSSTGDYTAPGANGTANVRVTDTYGNTSNATVTITTTLSIAPTTITLAVNNTTTFTGTGGTPPLSYSLVSGTGSINSSSGLYTAPASSGSATVRVTDSLGATADATITINSALAISPASQTLSINGSLSFSASGGVVPYAYSRFSGAGSVNASTGVYTAPGSIGTDVIRVTDSLGNTSDSTITINNSLGITPAAITLAVNNTTSFTGLSGAPGYTYSIFSGGGSINSGTGAFTAPAVAGTTVVRVTDTLANTADATVTVNAALAISPTTKTLAVNNQFTFTATGGVSPYAYSIFSGSGSINSSTGVFTAPAVSGTTVVRVTDGYGNTSNSTVTVNNALAISPSTDTITTADTKTFTSSGGASPYTYSVNSGTGSINASTGVYTPSGTGTITIRSTDSVGNTSDATLTVNTLLAITPTSAYVEIDSDYTFDYTGGVPPVTYSITAGGGTIADTSVGVYTAPSSNGSATVRVTDALGHTSSTSSITIYTPLSLSPTTVTLGINTNQTFTGAGGVAPLTYSMYSGNGSINSSSGVYLAPVGASSDVVQVSDAIGNTATASISVVSTLTISPPTLNLPIYSTATFSSVLGTPAYTYSVVSGSGSINSSTGVHTAASAIGSGSVRTTDSALSTSTASVTYIEPVEIRSGAYHTCVRYNNNAVKCWGDSAYGQLGSGSTSDLGDAANEGGGFLSFVNLGTGRTAKALAAGIYHTCAILDNDTVKCWGYNLYGQLGLGNTSNIGDGPGEMGDSLATVNLGAGRTATKIFAFGYETCAVLDNATTKCWGRNTYGQLAKGDVNHRGDAANEMGDNLTAINFGTGRTVTKLTGGIDFMCAVLDNSTLKCWGRARYGQVGNETSGTSNYVGDVPGETGDGVPVVNLGTGRTVVDIASGYSHSCVILDDSTLKCWGRNESGQLGKGSTSVLGDGAGEMGDSLTAVSLGTGFVPSKVWGLRQATCVLSVAGVLKCFGLNTNGQLLVGSTSAKGDGSGEMGDSLVAASLGTGVSVTDLGVGYYHACVLTTGKRIKCWGIASNGALLNATTGTHLGDSGGELGDSLPWVNH